MAGNSQFSNTFLDAIADLLDGGVLKIYDGPQPADANTAPGGSNHVLATFNLANPFEASYVLGVITAAAIASVTVGTAGVANWYRLFKSGGTIGVADGSIAAGTVTLAAAISATDTAMTVVALAIPLYAGQDLWFNDSGVLRLIHVTTNAAVGATSVSITSAAHAVGNGMSASGNLIMNNVNLTLAAPINITSLIITVPTQGT